MTLIELLVVIIVLTTIVAAAIPIMAPADSDRQLREATRGLNTFITAAQTRAIALRRPFGIALKKLSAETRRDEDNGSVLEVYYVEQQPPYAGFDANSRACVALFPGRPGVVIIRFVTRGTSPANDGLPMGWDVDLFPDQMIKPGDICEIGDTRYELFAGTYPQFDNRQQLTNGFYPSNWGGASENRSVMIAARPINDTGQQIVPRHDWRGQEISEPVNPPPRAPFFTAPAPYKILRQPTPTSDAPFQMPTNTAIDLRASGIGNDTVYPGRYFYVPGAQDNPDGVMIMFTPEGRVQRVYFNPNFGTSTTLAPFDEPVVDNIYLLVGRPENIPMMAATDDPTLNSSAVNAATTDAARTKLKEPLNWLRGDSRWIVIGPQSGRVVSVENAAVEPAAVIAYCEDNDITLPEAMRNEQIKAAREFTREMQNVGGR